ncbi:MAG: YfhO family protein [Anaerolineae bacterium]|nr:YfhO family protein [Anaerolineae bacterium]
MWPRSGLGSDLVTYNWTSAQYVRQSFADIHQFPLWWDTTMGGMPLVGNPSVRALYPPISLAILLPVSLFQGFAGVNAFSLWIAGIGMYLLVCWTMPTSRYAAFLAAVIFMLTPRISANIVGDMGYTAGLCWTPLTLACIRVAINKRAFQWAIAAGLCYGLLFTLNFVNFLYLGLFVAVYGLLQVVRLRHVPRELLKLSGVGALMLVTLIGTAAFMLFPLLTFLPYQSRQAFSLADANYLALPLPFLFEVLLPNPFKFPEWTFYVGLLPLTFALFSFRTSARREFWWWVGILLFSVVFALGTTTPLYGLIVQTVPGFSLMRVPSRMLMFAVMALAALSAPGIDVLMKNRASISKGWIGLAILLTVVTIAGRFFMRRPEELDWLLGLLAGFSVITAWIALALRRYPLKLILAICVALELLPLAASYMRVAAFEEIFKTPPIADRLIEDNQNGELFRIFSVERELPDHILTLNQLQSVDGLNSFQFTHYADFMRAASGCPIEAITAAIPSCASPEVQADAQILTQPDPALLGLLNVRYMLASFALENLPSSLQMIAQDGDHRLYLNAAELPRAFATNTNNLSADAPATLSDSEIIPAAIHQAGYGLFDLSIEVPEPMTLVISETWAPGWQAVVDGQAVLVERVSGALLGIELGEGAHHVQMSFAPPTFTIGMMISLGTLILAGVVLFYARSARRGNSR